VELSDCSVQVIVVFQCDHESHYTVFVELTLDVAVVLNLMKQKWDCDFAQTFIDL
jgi:hypothetical protein